jgi:hypothetical protein
MWEISNLQWISPIQYLLLGVNFFDAGSALLKFLNRVVGDRWSRVEMAVDGKTWEYGDVRLSHSKSEENATREEVAATEDAMLLQMSSSSSFVTRGPPTGETGFYDAPIMWTQEIRVGFLELPKRDFMPSVS